MILSLKLTHFDIFTTIPMHTWTIDFLLAYSRMNSRAPNTAERIERRRQN